MWRITIGIPYWHVFRTPAVRRYEQAMDFLQHTLSSATEERAAETKATGSSRFTDLLELFLVARITGEAVLTNAQIVEQLLTFLFAGHDTTTNLLSWAIYYIATEAGIFQKVQIEVDAVFDTHPTLSYEALSQLTYLTCVIKETLRLKPGAPGRGRTLVVEDELGEHPLPANSIVGWSAYATHRLPDVWPEPDKFNPDRFSESARKPQAGAFIPFGAGPRRCVGEPLALMEAAVVLSLLVRNFSFEMASSEPLQEAVSLTMHVANGVWMVFYPRLSMPARKL
eukprot:TRINITY_DN1199_c1_g1_i5.p1 TRINITY_DN1199_c1_g1~~TRINITY_DN1199_c1_g1_i5.p1  ORF type:complete len:282 (+),score=27.47 TRINITY_DN1199_c1_g1_i5:511-1356(+)